MRSLIIFIYLLNLFNIYSNNSIDHYFPLNIGRKVVYKNIYISELSNSHNKIKISWKSEIYVSGHYKTKYGLVIERKLKNKNIIYNYPKNINDKNIIWFKKNIPKKNINHFIIKNNLIYKLPYYNWDTKNKKIIIIDKFGKKIEKFSLFLIFPLTINTFWSSRSKGEREFKKNLLKAQYNHLYPESGIFQWNIEGITNIKSGYNYFDNVYIIKYYSFNGISKILFKNGIGIIRFEYKNEETSLTSNIIYWGF